MHDQRYTVYQRHFGFKDTYWKWRDGSQKKAVVLAILKSHKALRQRLIIRDKVIIMIILSIKQNDIAFVNTYALNLGTPKYIV